MKRDLLIKTLNLNNTISVNRLLARKIGLDTALIYQALISKHCYYEERNRLDEDCYFYSTIEDLEESTTLKRSVQDKAIKKLVELNLISTLVKGIPAKRHFKINFDDEILSEIFSEEDSKDENQKPSLSKNDKLECSIKANKNDDKEQQILSNKTKENETKVINQIKSYAEVDGLVKDQIEYDLIRYDLPNDISYLDNIVSIVIDVLMSNEKTIRVNKENKPIQVVKAQFEKLNMGHIKYVLDCLKKYDKEQKKPVNFVRTCLYNAVLGISLHNLSLVNDGGTLKGERK